MSLPFDDPGRPVFTVGQVADMLEGQQAFLRRLEAPELVLPDRSEGNQRRSSRDGIDRVSTICGLVDEGLTLAGVRRVLELQAEVNALKAELVRERSLRHNYRRPRG